MTTGIEESVQGRIVRRVGLPRDLAACVDAVALASAAAQRPDIAHRCFDACIWIDVADRAFNAGDGILLCGGASGDGQKRQESGERDFHPVISFGYGPYGPGADAGQHDSVCTTRS
jgi:hypothetical protein